MKSIEEEEILENNLMKKFPENINTTKCKKIQGLAENSVHVVESIEIRKFSNKNRYLFTVENYKDVFISNSFMEKKVEEK